jgi:hypothetical protein
LNRRDTALQAQNLKVVSSNLAPATNKPLKSRVDFEGFPFGDSGVHCCTTPRGDLSAPFAIGFGFDLKHAQQIIYSCGLDLKSALVGRSVSIAACARDPIARIGLDPV